MQEEDVFLETSRSILKSSLLNGETTTLFVQFVTRIIQFVTWINL